MICDINPKIINPNFQIVVLFFIFLFETFARNKKNRVLNGVLSLILSFRRNVCFKALYNAMQYACPLPLS